jgi:hypothetical protein
MKPEERLDTHVDRGRKIIATAKMTEFMGQDGFELLLT